MKRKSILGICLAAIGILVCSSVSAYEYEAAGTLRINNRTVFCETDKPVIVNDRMLIPVEKIMNYCGINAKFIESKNQIVIDSRDNIKRISLYIDDPVMQVYTYKTVLIADREDVPLDAAPRLVNGVPMFPLRAVSDILGFELSWDDDSQTVSVNTNPNKPAFENRCVLSANSDISDAKTGDIVSITINLSGTQQYEGSNLSAVTGCLAYDSQKFEYIGTSYVPDLDAQVMLEAGNGDFNNYAAKSVAVINSCTLSGDTFNVMTMKFKALTDDGGEFVLSDRFNTLRGADNDIIISDAQNKTTSISKDENLIIDQTPIIIK